MGPPSWKEEGERWLAFRSAKSEAMDPDAIARLLFRVREVTVPEDRVDLESRSGQRAGLFRDTGLHARGALRANEDDAGGHVIPRTRRPVARSASRSSRRRRDSAIPVSPRAGGGPRRGLARGRSPRADRKSTRLNSSHSSIS